MPFGLFIYPVKVHKWVIKGLTTVVKGFGGAESFHSALKTLGTQTAGAAHIALFIGTELSHGVQTHMPV